MLKRKQNQRSGLGSVGGIKSECIFRKSGPDKDPQKGDIWIKNQRKRYKFHSTIRDLRNKIFLLSFSVSVSFIIPRGSSPGIHRHNTSPHREACV